MIRLENISLKAGNFALSNINIHLENSKFHVLLGSTGSGKTLVLELIAGLIPAETGEVFIQQNKITKYPPEQRNIAYLPQDNALFPHKNVRQNISYGLELTKKYTKYEINQKVNSIAETLSINHLLNRSTKGLSGGEQQRVALARALVMDRKILLLDEPTSALHESMQEDFCLLLKELQKKFNLTIIMTTHHKDSAFLVADFLHFIDNGALQLSSSPSQVYKSELPKNIALLLGITNFLTIKRTSITNEYFCNELQRNLTFKNISNHLEAFWIGIKPENIRLIKNEDVLSIHENKLKVVVEKIFLKESNALVILRDTHSNFCLKMNISIYNINKLSIELGEIMYCRIKEELITIVS